MQTWGTGVFDNESAVEWAADFDRAMPEKRSTIIRDALMAALDRGDRQVDQAAVAAATTVAASLPGGTLLAANYGPKALSDNLFSQTLELPDLAVAALRRCRSADSEWSKLWNQALLIDDALAVVDAVLDELQERTAPPITVRAAS
jgi:hypothetical protein